MMPATSTTKTYEIAVRGTSVYGNATILDSKGFTVTADNIIQENDWFSFMRDGELVAMVNAKDLVALRVTSLDV